MDLLPQKINMKNISIKTEPTLTQNTIDLTKINNEKIKQNHEKEMQKISLEFDKAICKASNDKILWINSLNKNTINADNVYQNLNNHLRECILTNKDFEYKLQGAIECSCPKDWIERNEGAGIAIKIFNEELNERGYKLTYGPFFYRYEGGKFSDWSGDRNLTILIKINLASSL
jgi:hypothetical protein